MNTLNTQITKLYCSSRALITHTLHKNREAGQGSVEYLGLFAIVAIAIFVGTAAFGAEASNGQGPLATAFKGVIGAAFNKAVDILLQR